MLTTIKVKIWGKYRLCELLVAGAKRVSVRILDYERVINMPQQMTLDRSQVRKADMPIVQAEYAKRKMSEDVERRDENICTSKQQETK